MEKATSSPMRIDIDAVVRQRVPRRWRWLVPVRWLKRLICQDELNALLTHNADRQGSAFAAGVLDDLDVRYSLTPGSVLPDPGRRRVLYVSNHPLGGLDGMALIDMVAHRHGCEPRFVVNDLLMAVEPLRPVFVPVNKHGRQDRTGATALEEALEADVPMIIFPAGLVSRRHKGGVIADLEWKPSFVNYAVRYGRDIIPVHFGGRNSSFFYKFARLRTRLGIKLNIEMVRLPKEVVRARGSRFSVAVGEAIPPGTLHGGSQARAEARRIRQTVDSLSTANP